MTVISRILLSLLLIFIIPNISNSSVYQKTLANGFNTIIMEEHSSPLVSLQLWVGAGSTFEEDDEAGFAHFLEHLTFRSKDIAKRIEDLGGDINAYTTLDRTVYYLSLPKEHYEEGLKVLRDIFYSTEFSDESFNTEREVILEEMKRSYDTPQKEIYKTFFEKALKTHPARRPVIGYEETIKNAKKSKVFDFYKRFYIPEYSFLVVVGDIKKEEIEKKIENLFNKNKGAIRLPKEGIKEEDKKDGTVFIRKKNIKSCYLMAGFPTPNIYSQDVPTIDVLSYIYGESATSILSEELKEKKELVNYIYTYQISLKDLGFFIVQANFPCKNAEGVVEELTKNLFQKELQIDNNSLSKVLKNYETNYFFSREKYEELARDIGTSFFYYKDPDYSKKYIELIKTVSKDRLLKVKNEYIVPEKLTLVMLTPESIDEKSLIKNVDAIIKNNSFTKKEPLSTEMITLNNGIKISISRKHGSPTFAFNIGSFSGSRLEKEGEAGLSYVVSSSLLRGTKSKSYKDILDEIELMGGSISGYSTKNMTGLSGKFLKDDFERVFVLISDILSNFNPSKEEIEKVKKLVIEEIKRKRERPTTVLKDLYFATLFNNTNFAYPIEGTEETVNKFTEDNIKKMFFNIFAPERLYISISGDIPDNYLKIIKKYLEPIPSNKISSVKAIYPSFSGKELSEKTDFNQSHILIGFIIPGINSPLRANFHILSNILSNQSGRLFVNLRDKKGLAYTLGAFLFEFPEASLFNLYIGTSPEKVQIAKRGLFEEIKNLILEGVDEEELSKAKNQILFGYAEALQKNSDIASTLLQNHILFNDPLHFKSFQEEIKRLNKRELIDNIKEFFLEDKAVVVILDGKSVGTNP